MKNTKVKRKPRKIVFVTAILCVLALILGIVGLISNKNTKEEVKYKVKYVYLVNDEKEKVMPKKESDYVFDKYECTGKIKGKWDSEEWKFTPRLTKDSTCTLYFKTKEYKVEFVLLDEITIESTNLNNLETSTTDETSTITKPNTFNVKKDQNFVVTTNIKAGSEIKEITCTNEQKATFKDNIITLDKITDDTVCSVKTENSSYTVEAKVVNGTLDNVMQTVEFEKEATFNATPKSGYILDKIECTNEQVGKWANNKFSVSKVTNNTECTITFKSALFNVKVVSPNGTITGEATKTAGLNATISFDISAKDGYSYSNVTCTNEQSASWSSNSLSVSGITSDTTCTVNFTQNSEEE